MTTATKKITDAQNARATMAHRLNDIAIANMGYRVRKYAGAWVPVVILNSGKTVTFAHCATSADAMDTAIYKAAHIARGGAI